MGDMITAFFCLFTLLYVPMRVSDPCESHGFAGFVPPTWIIKSNKKKKKKKEEAAKHQQRKSTIWKTIFRNIICFVRFIWYSTASMKNMAMIACLINIIIFFSFYG